MSEVTKENKDQEEQKTKKVEVVQGNVQIITVQLLSSINAHLAEIVQAIKENS